MPGLFLWAEKVPANLGPFRSGLLDLANSQTVYDCDPCVLTNATASQNRLRLLSQDDIDDLYINSTTAGIAGFADAAWATDSSGNPANVPPPVSLSGSVAVQLPVSSIAALQAPDPISGRMRDAVLTCENLIAGGLWETTAVKPTLIGTPVGLTISTIGGVATFFWSTAATTKIGTIQGVDASNPLLGVTGTANVQDTTHYPRCPVVVQIDQTYNQLNGKCVVYED